MQEMGLIWPVLALVGLTVLVLLLIPILRIKAVLSGKAHIKDYRFGDTENVPERARLANRNYLNLLQIPVLFYVVTLLMLITKTTTELAINLAWAYVVLRVIHSLIHIGYNNVNHRFAGFLISNIILFVLCWELIRQLY